MSLIRTASELAGVPALLVSQGPHDAAASRGTVLFFHGLGASKETHAEDLALLAQRGFLAVGLDNVGHGERPPSPAQIQEAMRLGWHRAFIEAVRRTASEVPALLDALTAKLGAKRFGIAGVSMGGYVTYAALLKERRLTVAAPILGSPTWGDAPDSPHRQASLFFPAAILSQNAGRDTTVPPEAARALHLELEAYYASAPERQAYVEYPESGHMLRPRDWDAVRSRTLDWFDRFLAPGTPG